MVANKSNDEDDHFIYNVSPCDKNGLIEQTYLEVW